MKPKPKALAFLLVMAVAGVFLSGCSKRAPEPEPQAAAPEVAAPEVAVPEPAPKVMVFEEAALFDFDKAELKLEGKEQLNTYREQAQGELSSADRVRITGYTDNTGAADHNMVLSTQRAEAVRDYLASIGVDAGKMEASGGGDANPIADNATEEGRAKNRRVEVEVTGTAK